MSESRAVVINVRPAIFHHLTEQTALVILSFIGGDIDAFGYINLIGNFPASITGNIVVASLSILTDRKGMFDMLLTIVFFFIGGLTITLVLSAVKRSFTLNDHQLYQSGFCLEIMCLIFVPVIGTLSTYNGYEFTDIQSIQVIGIASLLGFTMGIHNAVIIQAFRDPPSTTAMTMRLVKLSLSVAKICDYYLIIRSNDNDNIDDAYVYNVKEKHKTIMKESVQSILVLTAFVIGAISVSGLNQKLMFPNLSLPIVILIYLVNDIYQSEHHQLIDATEQSQILAEMTATNTRIQSTADDFDYSI